MTLKSFAELELFEEKIVLSPRMKWLKEHGITTEETPQGWIAYKDNDPVWDMSYDPNDLYKATEEDAIYDLMQRAKIPPFNPDQYR